MIILSHMAQLLNDTYVLIIMWKVNTKDTQSEDITKGDDESEGRCVCASGRAYKIKPHFHTRKSKDI